MSSAPRSALLTVAFLLFSDVALAAEPAPTSTIPAPSDVAAAPPEAQHGPRDLAWKVLRKGTGKEHPTEADVVELHYTGWTAAGKMFDSSVARGKPARFPLKAVLGGWTLGIPMMVVGEKRRLWIPASLAYGQSPLRAGAPGGPLVFDIELLAIQKAPSAPPAPPDVKAPPASARRTSSGLASRVLKKGTGKEHPREQGSVLLHYTGWKPDGTVFDSSYLRGAPLEVRLRKVILGWTEGLQLMVRGEKRRFWVPARLAHGDAGGSRADRPAGDLVFDVELLAITSDHEVEGERD